MIGFRHLFISFLLVFSTLSINLVAQNDRANEIVNERGEVILKFCKPENFNINQLTRLMSIDKVKGDTVTAYFNSRQLSYFNTLAIPYHIVEPMKQIKSALAGSIWEWNKYPTYNEYLAMMDSFQNYNPQLCKTINIGYSKNNKEILFARINADTTKAKPSVMYSSTMHGDETGGYVLMLRLINYLLSNYKKDTLVTELVNNLDIWINPLANPDGTYFDQTVFSATRFNASNIDLNRNYPDPLGQTIEYPVIQPETQAMINLMKSRHFVLSANFHAGSEVVNYPWDRDYVFHADKNWFEYISYEYADSAQFYGRANYFTDVDASGVIDGAFWYKIYGGRQDFITYLYQGRETTIELDAIYVTPESKLQNLWNYNFRSLLHYLEQATFGIQGIVADSQTGIPVKAKIELLNHDDNNSFVFSDSLTGAFYRPVFEGNYDVRVTADGYFPQTKSSVSVVNRTATQINFFLEPDGKSYTKNILQKRYNLYPNPCKNYLTIEMYSLSQTNTTVELLDLQGHIVRQYMIANFKTILDISQIKPGIYLVRVIDGNGICIDRISKIE